MGKTMVSDEDMFKNMKPCPFCGLEPIVLTNTDEYGDIWYTISCVCLGELKNRLDFYDALEVWNKRKEGE